MNGVLCVGMALDVDRTESTELARFLLAQNKKHTLIELEEITGVPDSTISKIIKGQLKGLPELETLTKLATAYNLPLWRVVEMSGVDVGMAQSSTAQSKRLATLVDAHPEVMNGIVDRLIALDPGDLRGVLLYLEVALRSHD